MSTTSPYAPVRSKLPTIGLALLLFAAVLHLKPSDSTVHATSVASMAPMAAAVPPVASAGASSYADLVSRVAPSVVTIRSERRTRPARMAIPDDPLLRRFFGDGFGPQMPRREAALGSGVVVSADGYVLTNHHVVDGAQRIEVELSDRRTYTAKRIGSDAASDLAVLKVEAPDLRPLPLGDSRSVRVGDVVLAFGNPLGIGPTVTSGIISAKGRATGSGDGSFEDFLQTDAPINQGNSGGALVNMSGQLIGINSQIVSPSGGNIGIGFAIPSAMADDIMRQLVGGGTVHRGQLGVTVQAVSSDIARSLGMKEVRGALVSSVTDGSAAEKAGVKRGDVILALNGAPVSDGNSLRNEIAGTKPGSTVKLTVRRNGGDQTLAVTLGELTRTASREGDGDTGDDDRGPLGLRLRPLTRSDAKELGLESNRGLLVAEVADDGPAAAAGFRSGDVIQEVDGRPVADAEAFRAAVKAAADRPALVLVTRDRGSLYLPLDARG